MGYSDKEKDTSVDYTEILASAAKIKEAIMVAAVDSTSEGKSAQKGFIPEDEQYLLKDRKSYAQTQYANAEAATEDFTAAVNSYIVLPINNKT